MYFVKKRVDQYIIRYFFVDQKMDTGNHKILNCR